MLTISQGFEDDSQQLGSTEANHSGGEFGWTAKGAKAGIRTCGNYMSAGYTCMHHISNPSVNRCSASPLLNQIRSKDQWRAFRPFSRILFLLLSLMIDRRARSSSTNIKQTLMSWWKKRIGE